MTEMTTLKLDHVRSLTPSQAWDEYVGDQSTREFEELCDGEPIEQAVDRYLAETREQWGTEREAEAHVARLLVRHIEANRSGGAEKAAAPRAEPPASDPRYAVLVCGHIVGRYDSLSEAEAEADRLNADECDDIVGDGAASVWDTWTE